jgi:hypothetical protein
VRKFAVGACTTALVRDIKFARFGLTRFSIDPQWCFDSAVVASTTIVGVGTIGGKRRAVRKGTSIPVPTALARAKKRRRPFSSVSYEWWLAVAGFPPQRPLLLLPPFDSLVT